MVKVDKTTASMSDAAIDHTIKLTVKNGKYYITTCSETTCNYTEFDGSSEYGTVDRDTLRNCMLQLHSCWQIPSEER